MNKPAVSFAIIGSIMTIIFFYIINNLYSPGYIWYYYPAFGILWWPLSMYFNSQKRFKEFSVIGALFIIAFLITINYSNPCNYPWFLYACFPIIWWPISMFAGKQAATVKYALFVSLCTIVYYSVLNYVLSPIYPWAIYPAFAVLWWPLSLYFAHKRQYTEFAFVGSIYTILFFAIVNIVSSPNVIWAVYPAFAILWWPISVYYATRKKFYNFSIVGSGFIILFLAYINLSTSPHTIWFLYPTFGLLWWPLCMYFFGSHRKNKSESKQHL